MFHLLTDFTEVNIQVIIDNNYWEIFSTLDFF